ncbi:MAG TPA: hypothetical protein ENN84_00775 [Candidatus Marinimicrobia bacterium]|nr:hypothetical protein [Candidatus Neomarinimicrobiota bacterium]
MKRTLLLLIFLALLTPLSAQVVNTASTLKVGKMSVGVYPLISDGFNLALLFDGGYGLKKGMDLRAQLAVGGGNSYLGFDVEKIMRSSKPMISFSGGAHLTGGAGLDATLNFSSSLNRDITLFAGLDTDLELGDAIFVPMWLFVGGEMAFRKKMTLILELDAAVNDASSRLVIGANFYL